VSAADCRIPGSLLGAGLCAVRLWRHMLNHLGGAGRHRSLLPAFSHRPNDGLVEDPRLSGANAGRAEEADRQRPCRWPDRAPSGTGGERASSDLPARSTQTGRQFRANRNRRAVGETQAPSARSIISSFNFFRLHKSTATGVSNAHCNRRSKTAAPKPMPVPNGRFLSFGLPSSRLRRGKRSSIGAEPI